MKRGSRFYPKRIREPKSFPVRGSIKPTFCVRADLKSLNPVEQSRSKHNTMIKNTPITIEIKNSNSRNDGMNFIDKDFNFSSTQPIFTKDFVRLHPVHSMPCLSYMIATNKKIWDFYLKKREGGDFMSGWNPLMSRADGREEFLIIKNIWIYGQQRRDMIGFVERYGTRLKLLSLSERKVIFHIDFGNYGESGISLIWEDKDSKVSLLILKEARTPILVQEDSWASNLNCMYMEKIKKFRRVQRPRFFAGSSQGCFHSVRDKEHRRLGGEEVSSFYENLMATKFIWVDKEFYNRDYENECKYQLIYIREINHKEEAIVNLKSLESITEGMFSAYRVDSFFFTDRETLALFMEIKLYLVAWRNSEVLRCVDIRKLYGPLLDAGFGMETAFLTCWHDRRKGIVRFCVGVQSEWVLGREDCAERYLDNENSEEARYLYRGWFSDEILYSDSGMDYFVGNEQRYGVDGATEEGVFEINISHQTGSEEKESDMKTGISMTLL